MIDLTASDIAGTIRVADTGTVDLTLDGSGSTADPYVLTADAQIGMGDLADIAPGQVPQPGYVPVFDGTRWEFAPPPTTPPGAVSTGAGVVGDGSAAAPIRAAVSGTWGTPPLAGYGTDPAVGQVVYIDAAGQLRTEPDGPTVLTSGQARPQQYPGRLIVEDGRLLWSDGTTWQRLSDVTTLEQKVAAQVASPRPVYQRGRTATTGSIAANTNFWLAAATATGSVGDFSAHIGIEASGSTMLDINTADRFVLKTAGVYTIEAIASLQGTGTTTAQYGGELWFQLVTGGVGAGMTGNARNLPHQWFLFSNRDQGSGMLATTRYFEAGTKFRVAGRATGGFKVVQWTVQIMRLSD